jgi:hypothetical protein
VAIYSSRSESPVGLIAMQQWLNDHLRQAFGIRAADAIAAGISWPKSKPAAFLTIDDRALTFDGTWPSIAALKAFVPWNKKRATN